MAVNGRKRAEDALLTALAAGLTIRQAAEQAGLGERTVYRRLAERDTRRRVAELRAGMVERALGRMAESMAQAADTLRSLLTAESDSVKLGSARALLELGVKLRESVDYEQRLQALEERAENQNEGEGDGRHWTAAEKDGAGGSRTGSGTSLGR